MSVVSTLDNASAVDLASAWVSHHARALGIRALVIKGPLAGRLGLRAERVSADADLLIEPGRLDELTAHLSHFGWYERPAGRVPRIVEAHSVSMIHDDWPIDLDLHSFWPGFLGEPAAVFDSLWSDRLELSQANAPVAAPGIAAGILILVLHSLRNPLTQHSGRVDTLESLRQAAVATLSPSACETLVARAAELGAVQTAAPFLRLLGAEIAPDADPSDELTLWRVKSSTSGNVGAWLLDFRNAHGAQRVRIAQRALLPAPSDLRAQHPELPPGPHGVMLGWFRRWRTGLSEVPRAVTTIRRSGLPRRKARG
ncbi:hypothetical protein B7R22_02905 [Subtercola boreus]|uniref:Nucleotidyltransferase family protein n=1 Tax=Subtercola boreus TaxID=120213 RepID=A0A3E0W2D3_9MICO|nr:hypothetical protein [Subtercola boreus]RFA16452.1 hypothetical protein B7R22_02905 [Subtercola boreus]